MNNQTSFLGLLHNAALLLGLILLFDILVKRKKQHTLSLINLMIGFIIGGIGLVIMVTPWTLAPGVVFDTRSVLLSVSGLFFGAIPTVIAMLMTLAFRLFQGGNGALTGCLVILATGSLGIAWHHLRKGPLKNIGFLELYIFGIVNHIVMLLLMLTLPEGLAHAVLTTISVPVMLIYPLGSAVLGAVLRNRLLNEEVQETLLSTTTRLNATQKLTKMGGWEWDVRNQKMYWTDETYRIHGYSPEDIPPGSSDQIDKSIHCYKPEDQPIIQDAFQKCVEFGFSYDFEFPFTTVKGESKWIRTKAEPVIENRQVIRVVGNFMDITDKKLAEQEIIESENKFRLLIEKAPVGIVVSDNQERTINVNVKFTEMTGYTLSDMPSVTEWWLLACPDETYREMVKNDWQQWVEIAIKTGSEIVPNESKVHCKDGSDRYFEIGFVATGQMNIVTFVDVTERKIAEEALRQSDEFSRALMDNLPIGVAVNSVFPQVEFVYMNEKFPKIYCTTRETLTDPDTFWEAVYEDPEFREQIKQKVLDGISSGDSERMVWEKVPITRQGKETRYVSAWDIPLPERNIVISTVLDVTDQTINEQKLIATQKNLEKLLAEAEISRRTLLSLLEDQKTAEEEVRKLNLELEQRVIERTAQLEASNKELEAFAYSVSHDLRAPLRGIDGFSRILEQEYARSLDDEAKRLLGIIRKSTKKMDQLIIDILALSRVSRAELKYSMIDMTTMANSMYHEIASKDILEKFHLEINDLPEVGGDPTLLRQVWANLISNAIKYTNPKNDCKIIINGFEDEGFCTYSIQDNGVGYDPRYANKLFGLFQRLHSERDFEGTGIGLAIVQRIIHRHNGRVWSESSVGEGATFYFSIPNRQVKNE